MKKFGEFNENYNFKKSKIKLLTKEQQESCENAKNMLYL